MIKKITALSRIIPPLLLLTGSLSIHCISHASAMHGYYLMQENRIRQFHIKERRATAKRLYKEIGADTIDFLIYQKKEEHPAHLVAGYIRQEYGEFVTKELERLIGDYLMSGDVQISIGKGHQLIEEANVMDRELSNRDCKVASGLTTLLLFVMEATVVWDTFDGGSSTLYPYIIGALLTLSTSVCMYTWCRRG